MRVIIFCRLSDANNTTELAIGDIIQSLSLDVLSHDQTLRNTINISIPVNMSSQHEGLNSSIVYVLKPKCIWLKSATNK